MGRPALHGVHPVPASGYHRAVHCRQPAWAVDKYPPAVMRCFFCGPLALWLLAANCGHTGNFSFFLLGSGCRRPWDLPQGAVHGQDRLL
jgi:hypothetical protein